MCIEYYNFVMYVHWGEGGDDEMAVVMICKVLGHKKTIKIETKQRGGYDFSCIGPLPNKWQGTVWSIEIQLVKH